MLYVRCEQIGTVSKYIGAGTDEGAIKLSKLGGTEWGKTKARVKSEVKQMAKELIALYAERMRRPGFAFDPDDDMQREFESLFEYEETDGQLAAAEDIKRDMEKPVPMDCSAEMWASAKRRWLCVRLSRLWRVASRLPYSCRRRYSRCSIIRLLFRVCAASR